MSVLLGAGPPRDEMDDGTTNERADLARPPSGEVLAAQIELTIAADARALIAPLPTAPPGAHAPQRVHDSHTG